MKSWRDVQTLVVVATALTALTSGCSAPAGPSVDCPAPAQATHIPSSLDPGTPRNMSRPLMRFLVDFDARMVRVERVQGVVCYGLLEAEGCPTLAVAHEGQPLVPWENRTGAVQVGDIFLGCANAPSFEMKYGPNDTRLFGANFAGHFTGTETQNTGRFPDDPPAMWFQVDDEQRTFLIIQAPRPAVPWKDYDASGCAILSLVHGNATIPWASRSGNLTDGDRITGCTAGEALTVMYRPTQVAVYGPHRFP